MRCVNISILLIFWYKEIDIPSFDKSKRFILFFNKSKRNIVTYGPNFLNCKVPYVIVFQRTQQCIVCANCQIRQIQVSRLKRRKGKRMSE